MQWRRGKFTWHTRDGNSTQIGSATITPRSRAWTGQWRGDYWAGGFVFNRPTSVRVERAGQVREHAIVDVTRWVRYALWGLTLLFVLNGFTAGRKHHGQSS